MIKNIFKPLYNNLNSLLPIKVKKISLKINNEFFFNKLSFRIDSNSISSFIGPNGAGKTSCIKLLTGLIKPQNGEILFSKNKKIPDSIGYVPQKIILLRRSVEENLLHALSLSNFPRDQKKKGLKKFWNFLN
tara:strand:- start:99 stop:494 length:396 start_codon:yes stop_codon:yes gene_type:complete